MQPTVTELKMLAHLNNATDRITRYMQADLASDNMVKLALDARTNSLFKKARDVITSGYTSHGSFVEAYVDESAILIVELLRQVVTTPIKTKTVTV